MLAAKKAPVAEAVLVETLEGRTVRDENSSYAMNPASVVKLATSLVVLEDLGADYRFSTTVWLSGRLDEEGTLHGDVHVSGHDPTFTSVPARRLAEKLWELGVRTITGGIIVTPRFTIDKIESARVSGERLAASFSPVAKRRSRRSPRGATASVRGGSRKNSQVKSRTRTVATSPQVISQAGGRVIKIGGGVRVGEVPAKAVAILEHKSARLRDILKVMLCVSDNFYAERLGELAGGPAVLSGNLRAKLKLSANDLKLASTSGLGINRVTAKATSAVIRSLLEEIERQGLAATDFLAVAGMDDGTLKNRFTGAQSGSVLAKTGTLGQTDGGASALAGVMRTVNGDTLIFVIFHMHGSVAQFRQRQDRIVTDVQSTEGGALSFPYQRRPLPDLSGESKNGLWNTLPDSSADRRAA